MIDPRKLPPRLRDPSYVAPRRFSSLGALPHYGDRRRNTYDSPVTEGFRLPDGAACASNDGCLSNNCIGGICLQPGEIPTTPLSPLDVILGQKNYGRRRRGHIGALGAPRGIDDPRTLPAQRRDPSYIAPRAPQVSSLGAMPHFSGRKTAPKPNGASCKSSSDCASKFCHAGTCFKNPHSNSPVTEEFTAWEVGYTVQQPNGAPCSSNSDCGSNNCSAGICQPGEIPTTPFSPVDPILGPKNFGRRRRGRGPSALGSCDPTDTENFNPADCIPGSGGTTTGAGDACSNHSDCPNFSYCLGGFCSIAVTSLEPGGWCMFDAQCNAGRMCIANMCVPVGITGPGGKDPLPGAIACRANEHQEIRNLLWYCVCDAGYERKTPTGDCVWGQPIVGMADAVPCTNAGGTWDGATATCTCPSGAIWDGSPCADTSTGGGTPSGDAWTTGASCGANATVGSDMQCYCNDGYEVAASLDTPSGATGYDCVKSAGTSTGGGTKTGGGGTKTGGATKTGGTPDVKTSLVAPDAGMSSNMKTALAVGAVALAVLGIGGVVYYTKPKGKAAHR